METTVNTVRSAGATQDGRSCERETGVVKRFIASRGFGFIVTDDQREYFLHISRLRPLPGDNGRYRHRTMEGNEHVSFVPHFDDHGRPQALDVEILGGSNG